MKSELLKCADKIESVELGRAKNQLKSSLLMSLESRVIQFDDIGRQVCDLSISSLFLSLSLCSYLSLCLSCFSLRVLQDCTMFCRMLLSAVDYNMTFSLLTTGADVRQKNIAE